MIPFLSLKEVTRSREAAINQAVARVVQSGWYLQGDENRQFEQEYAAYIGASHCVGCANGLDALILIFRAYIELGRMAPGDEVIVPANTYIATLLAITENGLKPRMVEPRPGTLQIDDSLIEAAIGPRTRAVCLVHLYGRLAYTERAAQICRDHNLLLVEDNAQAHGCRHGQRRTGSLGHAAGHSFYPGKNLGALGDGGAVTTSDDQMAQTVRTLANYGSRRKYIFQYLGRNSRLDEIQAAVLRAKLPFLDADNDRRRQVAARYRQGISNPLVSLPDTAPDPENVYHLFPVLSPHRDALQKHLEANGVQTLIHYPVPPHQQECYAEAMQGLSFPITERIAQQELSLPIGPVIPDTDVDAVIQAVNSFKI